MKASRLHVLFCSLLFLLHVVPQYWLRFPSVFYDELLYLGLGRFFAGAGPMPNMHSGAWGHFGYSAVLAPAFWMFREFPNQYHAVLFTNAILMTSTYPLLYFLLKRVGDGSSRLLASIAFVASIYPSFLLFSEFAISENLFTPLFLLTLLAWARFLEKPTAGRGAAVGLGCLGCYLAHNRGLSVTACAVVFGVMLGVWKRIPWRAAATVAGTAVAGVVVVGVLKRMLEIAGSPTVFPPPDFSFVTTLHGVGLWGLVLGGQLVYLVSSTFGLYLFGIGYLLFVSRGNRDLIRFLLAVHVCVYVGSAAFVSTLDPLSRADHVLMGRYNEGLLPVFLACGLLLLAEVRQRKILMACVAACVAVSVAGAFLLAPAINWTVLKSPIARINMLSFMPLYRWLGRDSLGVLLALTCAGAVLGALGSSLRRPGVVICAIAAIFLAEAGFYLSTDVQTVQSQTNSRIAPLIAGSGVEGPVYVETAVWNPVYFSLWQLLCADRPFRTFHGPGGAKKAGRLVIAQKDWRSAHSGDRNVGCEDEISACLWIRQ